MNKNEKCGSFRIWIYRAIEEPELCREYMKGHVKVLSDYGIINVTSANDSWTKNKNMYCVIAQESGSQKMLGGIRIQVAEGVFPLPVEDAIGKMDKRIYEKVKFYMDNGGVGELCGLWVSNELKGIGMAAYLVRAAIACSNQLDFKTMIGICAGYSLNMFKNVGFTIDNSLGNKGNFPYPNDTYIAHVVGILNAETLETAAEYDKHKMIELRNTPRQMKTEITNGIETAISYDLIYKNKVLAN